MRTSTAKKVQKPRRERTNVVKKTKISVYVPNNLLEPVRQMAQAQSYDLSEYFVALARQELFKGGVELPVVRLQPQVHSPANPQGQKSPDRGD